MITKEAQVALNSLLSNLHYFRPENYGTKVESKTDEQNNWNGPYDIVRLKEDVFGPETFIKVTYYESSYDGEYYADSIQFVQPKPKEVVVTDFVKIS